MLFSQVIAVLTVLAVLTGKAVLTGMVCITVTIALTLVRLISLFTVLTVCCSHCFGGSYCSDCSPYYQCNIAVITDILVDVQGVIAVLSEMAVLGFKSCSP